MNARTGPRGAEARRSRKTVFDSTVSTIHASGLRVTAAPPPRHAALEVHELAKDLFRASPRLKSGASVLGSELEVDRLQSRIVRDGPMNVVSLDTGALPVHGIALERALPALKIRDRVLNV